MRYYYSARVFLLLFSVSAQHIVLVYSRAGYAKLVLDYYWQKRSKLRVGVGIR